MGRNNGNSWLNAVRKAFRSPTKVDREENDQEGEDRRRGKRRWTFRNKNHPLETTIQLSVGKIRTGENLAAKQAKVDSSVPEQRRAIAVAMATAEAAVATARAAVDIIRLSTASPVYLHQHEAAVLIQTIFRGYLARRASMALKGIVKLQALIRAHIVRKRTKMTLQCIQSLVRVQTHVCDQRRRLSCEDARSLGSLFSQQGNSTTKSISRIVTNSGDHHRRAVEEIQALIQKAKECSFKQGKKTLGHVLSQEIWTFEEEQVSDSNGFSVRKTRKDRTLCNPLVQSPNTPSSIRVHSCNQIDESSCPLPRPNYMSATASTMARVRSHSTPRNRPSSPGREQTGYSAKKRLSFPVTEPHNAEDNLNNRRCKGTCAQQLGDEQRFDVPCYLTE